MTGPEHFREAERLLREAKAESCDSFADDLVIAAQAHATLALAAATALNDPGGGMSTVDCIAWHQVASAEQAEEASS